MKWNARDWFGVWGGSTSWMIILACFLFWFHQPLLAALVAGCCICSNSVALVLWARRAKLSLYRANLLMLGVLAITVPLAWYSTMIFASTAALEAMNWPTSKIINIVPLFAAPLMALVLHFRLRPRLTDESDSQIPNTGGQRLR
ncbi:hypothetical protein K227x_23340 [Rubripirellula lacrimiformis]|uniref:Uncharacterized protein n=1 Tax=Rubripirellula lacrimiformis TaxID=1930273 RepID=A0A517NAA8_9BACT|nr:hypothetical protein K227x_23340 [Rubripirellula lacrimiformis]